MTAPAFFRITTWNVRTDLPGVDFHYDCSIYGAFTETVLFPGLAPFEPEADPILKRIIGLLHSVLGVSYYKCAAASRIAIDSAPDDEAAQALIEAVYRDGLGEFFVRNGLSFPYPIAFDFKRDRVQAAQSKGMGAVAPASPYGGADALVGYGGGKDSHVAFDLARKAVTRPAFFKVRVHMGQPEQKPDTDILAMDRFLDPELRKVNAAGALNGHIPVTAINSLIALAAAQRLGVPHVIFANERSADEATAIVDGHGVNHQYSKTFALEEILTQAVGPGAPRYFSLMRPVSELWIARHFAGLEHLHHTFMSCNRNFRIGNAEAPTWCGECPKCAFTFLLFAPFIAKDRLVEVFRSELLDKPDLFLIYEELLGLASVKPWECVGTVEECRTILHLIARRPDWRDNAVVSALLPRVRAADPTFDPDAAYQRLMTLSDRHQVPEVFMEALRAEHLNQMAR